MFASAPSVESFVTDLYPKIDRAEIPIPKMYNLNAKAELDDFVGKSWVYGKSLLYLVSNSMESDRGKPIVGMELGLKSDTKLQNLYWKNGQPNSEHLVLASAEMRESKSKTHGGFDNDADTMNSVLNRILGHVPETPYTARDLANA